MEEYLEKRKNVFLNVTEELKCTKLSWEIYLILGLYFEYCASLVKKKCQFS